MTQNQNHNDLQKKLEELEEALREGEEVYRNLVERANDGIAIIQDGIPIFVNQRVAQMTGYVPDDIIGSSFTKYLPDSCRTKVIENYQKRIRGEEADSLYEAEIICRNGKILPVEISAVLITFHGKPADLAIIRDISERKTMEEELFKSKKLESIGILASGIAHDYNNLLTAIMGNISLALMYLDPDDRVSILLKEAEAASLRAKNLTQQLIMFSHGENLVKKTMTIGPLLTSAVEFALSGSKIKCHFSIPDDLWPVTIDDIQVGQAIHNLVTNAREALPKGGVLHVLAENVFVDSENKHALQKGKYLRITIEDHGPGILEKNLDKIFDPYFSTKEIFTQKGVGLGLSICHSIIKNHQGCISVESDLGIGTTVHIYLPSSEKDATVEKLVDEIAASGQGKILLMDDEEVVGKIACKMLHRLGYETVFIQDGAQAVDVYQKAKESGEPFSAVILDITVRGGLGGEETIQKIHAVDPDVKALASSGYSDDPIMVNFEKYGFKGFLTKPYSIQQLREALQKIIIK